MKIAIISFLILLLQHTGYTQYDEITIKPFKEFVVCGMVNYFSVNLCGVEDLNGVEFIAIQYDYKLDSISMEYMKIPRTLQVEISNGGISVITKNVGELNILIKKGDLKCNKIFKVRPLPVKPYLNRHTTDTKSKISVGELKASNGLLALIVNMDIQARCVIKQFELVRIPTDDAAIRHINIGGRFDEKSRWIINGTKQRDLFLFRKIMVKCPGDQMDRQIEGLSIETKESIYTELPYQTTQRQILKDKIQVGNGNILFIYDNEDRFEIKTEDGQVINSGYFGAEYEISNQENKAWVYRYDNGNLKLIGSTITGNKNKTWMHFYTNGNLKKIENYNISYDSLNNTKTPQLSGPLFEYYESGKIKTEGYFSILGKYANRDTSYIVDYDTYEEKMVIKEGDFWKPTSTATGLWKEYEENGQLKRTTKKQPLKSKQFRIIK